MDDYNEAGLECNTLIGSSNSSYNTLRVKETDEEAGFTMVWFRLLLLLRPTTTTTTTMTIEKDDNNNNNNNNTVYVNNNRR